MATVTAFGPHQPKVLTLIGELNGNLDGCSLWRCLQPMAELQRQGYPLPTGWDRMANDQLASLVHLYDAIVLARHHWHPADMEKGEWWINAHRKAGIAVIYEVDDDTFTDNFVRRVIDTHGKEPEKAEAIRAGTVATVRLCDGVTVSSQRLATIVRQLTDRPVVVVPNYIDLDWFRSVQRQAKRLVKGLSIGWAGGARPDADVEQMADAWARIAARFPHVTFVVQGHHAPAIYSRVPHDRIAAIEWLPIAQYPAGLVNIDIGCCPLSDTPFNRAKTFIKAMEYAATGAAVVASPTVYGQILEHGKDGYICRSADEWETALAILVESANTRKRLAQNLLRKVEREHSLAGNVWRWPAAWQEIIDDFRHRQRRAQLVVPAGWGMRVQA
jgi:glycosyltransferase involved in cell wall biosynthesis